MQMWITKCAELLSGPIMVWAATAVGLFLTIKSGFVQIRFFGRSLRTVFRGLFVGKSEGSSSFRALATALSGTLGTGNIAGVAVAIAIGGAGSIFWMWISAILGMATKYTEITLAVRHRKTENGTFIGGPMYYLPRPLAVLFSFLCVAASFGAGNIVQANTAFCALRAAFPDYPAVAGLLLLFSSIVVFAVLRGGFSRVEQFSEKLLPVLTGAYLLLCFAAILTDLPRSVNAFTRIFTDAFSLSSAAGGTSGYLLMRAIRTGCAKGIFTNEAGLGSAPIAHASAVCDSPAEQGLWGIFEVFFDTIVMCTLTGVVVIGANPGGVQERDGIAVVMRAFSDQLGNWAGLFIGISVFFFALASILAWGGYALCTLRYLKTNRKGIMLYTLFYAAAVLLSGGIQADFVWNFADILNALMLLPNLFGIVWLYHEMQDETKRLNVVKSCVKQRKPRISVKKGGF